MSQKIEISVTSLNFLLETIADLQDELKQLKTAPETKPALTQEPYEIGEKVLCSDDGKDWQEVFFAGNLDGNLYFKHEINSLLAERFALHKKLNH